jgi:hypothetical protein
MKGTAGTGEPPYLLGDAVHVYGEADPPVADQRQPNFLLPHASEGGRDAALGRGSGRAQACRGDLASKRRAPGFLLILGVGRRIPRGSGCCVVRSRGRARLRWCAWLKGLTAAERSRVVGKARAERSAVGESRVSGRGRSGRPPNPEKPRRTRKTPPENKLAVLRLHFRPSGSTRFPSAPSSSS